MESISMQSPSARSQTLQLTLLDTETREAWAGKADFLLSVIGFAVDLSNVWRFPYLCYKNGGGAFLIPYCIMLFIGGIPLFYMELALGQFYRKGAITCWGRIVPLFKGIGYAVVLIAFYVDFYYNVIIAWALRFFFASFTDILPWTTCDNEWNTPFCRPLSLEVWNLTSTNSSYDGPQNNLSRNETSTTIDKNFASAAAEYFNRAILEMHTSKGLDDLGVIKWDMALCLLIVYLICYFSLWKGISTSGKFGGSEAIITAMSDEFPIIGRNREIFVACLFSLYFIVGLTSCAQGGFYFFHLLDRYAAGYSMLFAVLFESIAVSWIYGTERFCADIKDMMGFSPGIYWRVCWRFAAPLFLIFIIVYGLIGYKPLTYEGYEYPLWANIIGWLIASSSVAMIPGMAVYKLLTTKGSFFERLEYLIRPWRDGHQQTTRAISLNGGDLIDPAQIRLTSPEAIDEV